MLRKIIAEELEMAELMSEASASGLKPIKRFTGGPPQREEPEIKELMSKFVKDCRAAAPDMTFGEIEGTLRNMFRKRPAPLSPEARSQATAKSLATRRRNAIPKRTDDEWNAITRSMTASRDADLADQGLTPQEYYNSSMALGGGGANVSHEEIIAHARKKKGLD